MDLFRTAVHAMLAIHFHYRPHFNKPGARAECAAIAMPHRDRCLDDIVAAKLLLGSAKARRRRGFFVAHFDCVAVLSAREGRRP